MATIRTPSFSPTASLVISSLVLLAATVWLGAKVRFAVRARPAQGEVTRTYPCRLGRRSGTCGDISYVTAEGFHGSMTGVQSAGPQGTRLDLMYDPAEPGEAQLSGPVKFWLGPVGAVLLSLAFVVTGVRQGLRRVRSR